MGTRQTSEVVQDVTILDFLLLDNFMSHPKLINSQDPIIQNDISTDG
jgi:hypothetical protein